MQRYRRYFDGDAMDEYLKKLGLVRKPMAKDETSIFRAVSEQIYMTQKLHGEIKQVCTEYLKDHSDEFEAVNKTHAQIVALSRLFKRDMIIYRELCKPPFHPTGNHQGKKVFLCESFGGHFDTVQNLHYYHSLAICQSIVYELLYSGVFGMEKEELDGAISLIRHRPPLKPRHMQVQDSSRSNSSELESSGDHKGSDSERGPPPPTNKPPFPFRVAKAMDPSIYRNIEYDAWLEGRKDYFLAKQTLQSSLPFPPGASCIVRWENSGMCNQAIIQDVSADSNRARIFLPEFGEMREVPMSSLQPPPVRGSGPRARVPPSHRGGRHVPNPRIHNGSPPRFPQKPRTTSQTRSPVRRRLFAGQDGNERRSSYNDKNEASGYGRPPSYSTTPERSGVGAVWTDSGYGASGVTPSNNPIIQNQLVPTPGPPPPVNWVWCQQPMQQIYQEQCATASPIQCQNVAGAPITQMEVCPTYDPNCYGVYAPPQQQMQTEHPSWVDGELPMLFGYGSTPENSSGYAELLSSGEHTDVSAKAENGMPTHAMSKPIPATPVAPMVAYQQVASPMPVRMSAPAPGVQVVLGGSIPMAQSTPSELLYCGLMPPASFFDPALCQMVNLQLAVPSGDWRGTDLPLHDVTTLRYFFNLGCDLFLQQYYSQSMAAAAQPQYLPVTQQSLPAEPFLIEATPPPNIMPARYMQGALDPGMMG